MKIFMIAVIMAGGFLLTGSDGPYFPWVNIAGAIAMSFSGWMIAQSGGLDAPDKSVRDHRD